MEKIEEKLDKRVRTLRIQLMRRKATPYMVALLMKATVQAIIVYGLSLFDMDIYGRQFSQKVECAIRQIQRFFL